MSASQKNRDKTRGRRQFTGQQKGAIVKAHLVDGVPISELCEKHQIQVSQFYFWQKQLFENSHVAFETKRKPTGPTAEQRELEHLRSKLINKNEVIAELMEENVKAKKEYGEL
ncbi:MAG: transposase [Planctomycetota bacterium]|nr:transposase [Planctomycetota bacterium]